MVSVGSILEGKVVSVMPFGAFVDIGNKQSGLVHISELSSRYVKDINDCVKKGDTVKVKVIKIDESERMLMIKILKKGSQRAKTMAKVCYYCNCVFTFNYLDIHQGDDHRPYVECPQCKIKLYPYNHIN